MSRGPGRIERAIRTLFDAHPNLAFITDELAEHCYPDARPIERKHQIAVLRAAKNVIKDDPDWSAFRIDAQGCGWVFYNRDSVTSRAYVSGIAGHNYRSEKRAARKKYDWVRIPGARMRLPYGTVIKRWAERSGYPHNPAIYDRRVWQRDDLVQWVDGDGRQQTYASREGDVAWHRAYRGADDARRQVLDEAVHAIWLRGHVVWHEWLMTRAMWADKPEIWLKRYPAVVDNGKETHTDAVIPPIDLSRLTDRLRALMTQNDPDAVRTGLAEIADALDDRAQR